MIGRLLRGGFMTLVYAYLYIPIVILIVNSFNASRFGISWQGATTKWYSTLLNNDSLLQAAGHSLTMAVLSATFATLIGSLTAVALYRYRFRGKPFVGGMLFVVMMSPDIVMAISLLVLFMLLGISLGFWSLLFSHITFCLPFVVVTVYARLKGFDVKMLEAARDLGASEFTILRKIILPLAMPAVAAGWLLSLHPVNGRRGRLLLRHRAELRNLAAEDLFDGESRRLAGGQRAGHHFAAAVAGAGDRQPVGDARSLAQGRITLPAGRCGARL
jgi:ABC-type spermidine/putrescine transport system, permease component II